MRHIKALLLLGNIVDSIVTKVGIFWSNSGHTISKSNILRDSSELLNIESCLVEHMLFISLVIALEISRITFSFVRGDLATEDDRAV